MPDPQTVERAKEDQREGKAPSTQAGEFVREELHHIREGKHGARSPKQAIAIGLSKARRPRQQTSARPGARSARTGARGRSAPREKQARRFWSQDVTAHSNALDLAEGVFNLNSPTQIARSLKRSAEASARRRSEPFRSALSMLTFYVNRAGKNLSSARKAVLMKAKDELRAMYGKKRRR